jgi:hypothetical protein
MAQSIRNVMTANPITMQATSSLVEAARGMRDGERWMGTPVNCRRYWRSSAFHNGRAVATSHATCPSQSPGAILSF